MLVFATSGCVTSLGYVPGYVKQDQGTRPPTYDEVRQWASDVAHGYDTRATVNRYAGYYGAVFAAAAVGTLAGLAAFDSGSPAIKGRRSWVGLPGYSVTRRRPRSMDAGRGMPQVSSSLSDKRFQARIAAGHSAKVYLEEANAALERANKNLGELRQKRDVHGKLAAAVRQSANSESDAKGKEAAAEFASATEKLVHGTDDAVTVAMTQVHRRAALLHAHPG
jgi:hypothetical protein